MLYPTKVWLMLATLVVTGSLRTIAVEVFYQKGFENPLFVSNLYFLAGALPAWMGYFWSKWKERRNNEEVLDDIVEAGLQSSSMTTVTHHSGQHSHRQSIVERRLSIRRDGIRRGSTIGISDDDRDKAEQLLSQGYLRNPILALTLSGVLNFCTYTLRWLSLVYLPASEAELLMNGFELILSVVASRFSCRKRTLPCQRVIGVIVVAVSLAIIGVADVTMLEKKEEEGVERAVVGIVITLFVGVFAVAQAVLQEIVTQEGNYPVLLVVGSEGLVSLFLGLALYVPMAPLMEEISPVHTWNTMTADIFLVVWTVVSFVLFAMSILSQVYALAWTSTTTRNIWEQLRSILVWVIGLALYYLLDGKFGEPWVSPYSWFVLLSFCVLISGLFIYYYRQPPKKDDVDHTNDDLQVNETGISRSESSAIDADQEECLGDPNQFPTYDALTRLQNLQQARIRSSELPRQDPAALQT